MKRKCLAVGIILLFVGTGIIPSIAKEGEEPFKSILKNNMNSLNDFKNTFIFGKLTNLTNRAGYIEFKAVELRVISIFPFGFKLYNSGENVCIAKEYIGFIGQRYLITLCQSLFMTSPLQLLITVSIDKEIYEINESINVTITVENLANEDVIVFFPDSQTADYRIRNVNNQQIYLWSYNRFFFPEETPFILLKGETLELLTCAWNQTDNAGNHVAPGVYFVDGWMTKSFYQPDLYAESVSFRIE